MFCTVAVVLTALLPILTDGTPHNKSVPEVSKPPIANLNRTLAPDIVSTSSGNESCTDEKCKDKEPPGARNSTDRGRAFMSNLYDRAAAMAPGVMKAFGKVAEKLKDIWGEVKKGASKAGTTVADAAQHVKNKITGSANSTVGSKVNNDDEYEEEVTTGEAVAAKEPEAATTTEEAETTTKIITTTKPYVKKKPVVMDILTFDDDGEALEPVKPVQIKTTTQKPTTKFTTKPTVPTTNPTVPTTNPTVPTTKAPDENEDDPESGVVKNNSGEKTTTAAADEPLHWS